MPYTHYIPNKGEQLMTSQFIYVVTTDCGDDERAFTNQSDAYSYKSWLEYLSEDYGIIQIKEMYLESNQEDN